MKFLLAGFVSLGLTVGLFFRVSTQVSVSSLPEAATITVDIPGLGSVMGGYDSTFVTNQTIMQFRGIPYARSPTGTRRFKAPEPKLPWRHIFDARNFGRRCPEIMTISKMSAEELESRDLEDCLNLCVYTKDLTARRPVMFYVYGGGFYNGSASDHPPRHLLEKDIVLVVPQYRIGALGWATLGTEGMPGNAPVKDLQLALQWVQDHVAAFGGDPGQVTIFGQSAGAAMTGALLLSPTTSPAYFGRAIIQSGSILAPWATKHKRREQVQNICSGLKCVGGCGTDAALDLCLRTAKVPELLKISNNESYGPVVGDLLGVLPQHPRELFASYNRSVPVMTGFTKHDGSFVLASIYDDVKRLVGNMSSLSVRQFATMMADGAEDSTGFTTNLLMRLLFEGPQQLNGHDHKQALPAYFDLTNDAFMKSPVIAFASQLVAQQRAPTFLYTFDYAGEHTRFGYEFGNEHYPFNGGVHHSDDNIYLFSTHHLNEADTAMAMRMVELWTSFAITGRPSAEDSSQPAIPQMEDATGPYFHINRQITLGEDVLLEITATLDDPQKDQLQRPDVEF